MNITIEKPVNENGCWYIQGCIIGTDMLHILIDVCCYGMADMLEGDFSRDVFYHVGHIFKTVTVFHISISELYSVNLNYFSNLCDASHWRFLF